MSAHPPDPATPAEEALFEQLDTLGVNHETHRHEPLFTVEESQALRGTLPGAHIKNLFLRDKKKNIWLVTALEDRQIDLKALRKTLQAKGNLSFGNAELLLEVLGVIPGAVTPFGVQNDREGRATMVLDQSILDHELVNAHPLRNDRTTAITPDGLLQFLESQHHAPVILDFDTLGADDG
ncbi:MAG: prolyl-tRNA synthetase associated domain-containing protein [Rhodospirillaceae bacterium]|nr:prolyl-tRNA synthetase associated domain-containing protein [Rhodospirillaceae bacterium]MDD9925642.1 prolyl-tRNA synthetase associated domain-containing protein [Rhodospirillaceae bacterium]